MCGADTVLFSRLVFVPLKVRLWLVCQRAVSARLIGVIVRALILKLSYLTLVWEGRQASYAFRIVHAACLDSNSVTH